MNGGLDRDVVEDLWRKRRRKGQKKGDKIGFCNADRLQADENGIAALCTYLVKQGCGKSGGIPRITSKGRTVGRTTASTIAVRLRSGRKNTRPVSFGKRNIPVGP